MWYESGYVSAECIDALSWPCAPSRYSVLRPRQHREFDSATPGTVSLDIGYSIGAETLLDIDIRPANGALYGLSSGVTSIRSTWLPERRP
jgi:hypothetical protein